MESQSEYVLSTCCEWVLKSVAGSTWKFMCVRMCEHLYQLSRFGRKPPVFRDCFCPPVFASKPRFFLFSSKKSQICVTYSPDLRKNSTSNANLLQQLKKLDRVSKIQDRLHVCLLRTLQATKRNGNKVENQVEKLVLLAKMSQILRQKAPDPP